MAAKPRASSRPAAAAAQRLDRARLAHPVGYAASRAALLLRKVCHRHMVAPDLKLGEFSTLMRVAQSPQVNQKQLGAALDVSAPNMAATLDRMVERGQVERVRSTTERALLIELLNKAAAERGGRH